VRSNHVGSAIVDRRVQGEGWALHMVDSCQILPCLTLNAGTSTLRLPYAEDLVVHASICIASLYVRVLSGCYRLDILVFVSDIVMVIQCAITNMLHTLAVRIAFDTPSHSSHGYRDSH
jgi:hypothetical protein